MRIEEQLLSMDIPALEMALTAAQQGLSYATGALCDAKAAALLLDKDTEEKIREQDALRAQLLREKVCL